MFKKPQISVIIPTFNRATLIENSINSVLSQIGQGDTYDITEIIIVDDCSTDNTQELISSFSQKNPIIKYIKNNTNLGPSGSRNNGAKIATGDWIALLDSDDLWYPEKLLHQVSNVADNPSIGMTYCKIKVISYDKSEYYVPHDNEDRNLLSGNIYVPLLIKNFIGAPSILVKKTVWDDIHGFDETMRNLEDWDFVLRVAKTMLLVLLTSLFLKQKCI